MELLYLLCSIISTFFTAFALSLLLPFQALLQRRQPSSDSIHAVQPVSVYEGTVWHERRRPVHHSFRYNVRYALFDLDHAPQPPPNHLSASEARSISETNGLVLLLTIPPSVGYEQNPLSLYYCYDVEGSIKHLRKCIAEVTNTPWGERVSFIFDPESDLVAKPLHVSPFMDMLGNWNIKAGPPEDSLSIAISVQHPKLGNYFTATLKAKRLSPSLVSDHAVFFWLMPHKVALWIYWHALKLWWKGVPFMQHPRYTIPNYKEEALTWDQKLKCCGTVTLRNDIRNSRSDHAADTSCGRRWFVWRDANWPWC